MSHLENVVTTTFRARAGNVISQLGSYAQGFGNIGRVINENTRMSERFNNQWRAIGTTLRYALAGGAIFGLTRLVGQLRDVNKELGLAAAIGSQPSRGMRGGIPFTLQQVTQMGEGLQKTALDTITPLQQTTEAAVNFLSTVQNVKPSDIPSILTQIGQAATLAQTPIETLTQAATTMNIAFGRSNTPKSIGEFTRMWFALISTAPGGVTAAPQIAQAIPSLASMFQLAPGRGVGGGAGQAQMMSLVLGALRTGMPPATAMRGVTYLLQSLAQPTGGARGALAGIGITPEFVQQRGIYAAVMKLLNTITRTGNPRQLGQLDEETLGNIEAGGGNLPGIPAQEMVRLRTMIPRIHGIRAAIILASQLQQRGNVESLGQDLEDMLQAQNNTLRDSRNMAGAWRRFRQRAKLQEASNAINVMSLQVASAFEPVFNFVASGVIRGAHAMQSHRGLTRDIALGGGAFLGAMGIGRFLGIGRLPGIRNIPGLSSILGGGAGQAFVRANAARAAMAGSTEIGGSPQNPLYVTVVGQIFGGGTAAPGGGGGGGITKRVEDAAKGAGIWGVVSRFGGRVLPGAGLVGGAWATRKLMEQHVLMPMDRFLHLPGGGTTRFSPTGRPYFEGSQGNYAMSRSEERYAELHRAQQIYGRQVTGIESYRAGMLRGRAEIFMVLDQKDASGKVTRRRVHVPVDLWQGGRHPSSRAQTGKGTRGR